MSGEYYGGKLDELHPERTDVINEALGRYEAGEDTPADRFALWADVALSDAWTNLERATARDQAQEAK